MPTVTVVIPCRDRAALLERALTSALEQTLPPQEIIVVDDYSHPPLSQALDLDRDPRLRVIRLDEPSGPARARNVAVAQARSEWIAFLDSDDEWKPHRLERQFAAMDLNAPGAPEVGYCLVENHGPEPGRVNVPVKLVHESHVFFRLVEGCKAGTSTFVMRRSAFEAVGGFDTSLPSAHDTDLLYRLALAGKGFSAVNEPLTMWHDHSQEQISHNPGKRWRGLRRLNAKWKDTITRELGPVAYYRWKSHRVGQLRRLVGRSLGRSWRSGPRRAVPGYAAFWAFLLLYQIPFFGSLVVRKRLNGDPVPGAVEASG